MKLAAKLPSPSPSRGASSSPPAHRLSHAIAKAPQPKIRIIHVVEDEVIKTEARHFRELVQRLTGKAPPKKGSCASSAAASTGGDASPSPSPSPPTSVSSSCDTAGDEGLGAAAGILMKVKEEPAETSFPSAGGEGGGFLRALELDGYHDGGFCQGLDDFLFNSCDMDGAAVAGFQF